MCTKHPPRILQIVPAILVSIQTSILTPSRGSALTKRLRINKPNRAIQSAINLCWYIPFASFFNIPQCTRQVGGQAELLILRTCVPELSLSLSQYANMYVYTCMYNLRLSIYGTLRMAVLHMYVSIALI